MNLTFSLVKKHVVELLVLLVLAVACANPMSPTGGPKDETPPKVIKSSPPNFSTNFKENEIVITFDEYINLKDINTQLIISPPVQELPDFRNKGKSLVVKFKEPWRSETTYNIFFGDAIVDITEGNPLGGYKFTFSTGDVLDSMMIKGKIINAFNLTPVKGAFVMLYDTVFDSIPYKQLPYYIAKTTENGDFELSNLRNKKYLIFGLTDLNANYLFDSNNEEISFIDSLISPWIENKKVSKPIVIGQDQDSSGVKNQPVTISQTDTTPQDSVIIALTNRDSIAAIDTIPKPVISDSIALNADSLILAAKENMSELLFHFKEVDSTQRLLKTTLLRDNVVTFIFKVPVKDPAFKFLKEENEIKNVLGYNTGRDSLTMWLPGYTSDSIRLKVSDQKQTLDTIEMSVKVREKNIKKNENKSKLPLKITNNLASGRIRPNSALRLTFADPLEAYDFSGITLKEDSLFVTNYTIEFRDSLKKQLEIDYKWKEGVLYSLTLPDSAMVGIMGSNNDSTSYSFMIMKEEETAKLTLNIDIPENTPYIIQLMDTKDKILSQYFISEDNTIEFTYLTPGKYKIKAIDDRNGNGYWDTGKYLLKRYPERVIFYDKELDLRANWTLDETWKIPESNR